MSITTRALPTRAPRVDTTAHDPTIAMHRRAVAQIKVDERRARTREELLPAVEETLGRVARRRVERADTPAEAERQHL